MTIHCPLPPKPAGFGEWVWEGLSGGCRAGLTLKRCSQLAAFAIQSVGWDAAAVWLAEDDSVPRCAPLPEPQFGALREGGGTREAGSTVAESLVVLYYRVGTHQIRRRRRAARSLTSQGRAEPLCARITGLNREVSEGKADLWPRSFFFLRGPQGAANGQDSWGFSKNAQGFGRLDAGSRAGFTSSRPPPPWTSVFRFSLFLYKMCGLEKLGLVDQNWLERIFPVFCWERWSWVGDNIPSRSRLLSNGVRRFEEPFWYWSVPLLVEPHNFLSRFGSLLVWVAGCHHDVTRWPSYLFVTTSGIGVW